MHNVKMALGKTLEYPGVSRYSMLRKIAIHTINVGNGEDTSQREAAMETVLRLTACVDSYHLRRKQLWRLLPYSQTGVARLWGVCLHCWSLQ